VSSEFDERVAFESLSELDSSIASDGLRSFFPMLLA
jgi:hypothetical protein